jgi:hypothetical protein
MTERSIGPVEGTSAALTGIGALAFAFFPLAIPITALTVVALIPFLAVGLVLGVVAAPFVLVARWLRGRSIVVASRRRFRTAPEGAR